MIICKICCKLTNLKLMSWFFKFCIELFLEDDWKHRKMAMKFTQESTVCFCLKRGFFLCTFSLVNFFTLCVCQFFSLSVFNYFSIEWSECCMSIFFSQCLQLFFHRVKWKQLKIATWIFCWSFLLKLLHSI